MQQIINQDLRNLYNWLNNNSLSVNVIKSKCFLLGTPSVLNKNYLNFFNEMKFLGFILYSNLKFESHAEYIVRKFSRKLNFIGRIISNYTKSLLSESIAATHLEFFARIIDNIPRYKIEKFQIVYNRAMRIF